MKKILYLFLTVSLIFSSCKKEDDVVVTPTVISGCMDATADNYNANATSETSTACTFSAEVVYFLFKSASDEMILNGVPYVYFWDDFDHNLGSLTYEYYYTSLGSVPCLQTNGTLHSGITWTGNSSTNGANFVYHIYLNDGSYYGSSSFNINAGECMKVGFYFSKEMLEQLPNR